MATIQNLLGSDYVDESLTKLNSNFNNLNTDKAEQSELDAHEEDTSNPHNVTKAQVGLGDVPNLDTSNAVANEHTHGNKAVLDQIEASLSESEKLQYQSAYEHITDTENPHEVTKDQVGLGNVDNTSDANKPISEATATALGNKVDNSTLISSLATKADKTNVLEKDNTTDFTPTEEYHPATKKYVDEQNIINTVYDTDTIDLQLLNRELRANITSPYVSKINTAYNHTLDFDNPHEVTKADVGLNLVDNEKQIPYHFLDTDIRLTLNSDLKVPSQKAIKTYVDGIVYGQGYWLRSGTTLTPFNSGDALDMINGNIVTNGTITASNLSGTNTGDQDLSGLVPYTGATGDLNLGLNSIYATNGYINDLLNLGSGCSFGWKGETGSADVFLTSEEARKLKFTDSTYSAGFVFDYTGISGESDQIITIPNLTGTMALTDAVLTAGSVPFVGTGGLLSQDNDNLFWDDTKNTFGIGSKTPKTSLEIRNHNETTGDMPGSLSSRSVGLSIYSNPLSANTRPGIVQYGLRLGDSGIAYSIQTAYIGTTEANVMKAFTLGTFGEVYGSGSHVVNYAYMSAASDGTYDKAAIKITPLNRVGINIGSTYQPDSVLHVHETDGVSSVRGIVLDQYSYDNSGAANIQRKSRGASSNIFARVQNNDSLASWQGWGSGDAAFYRAGMITVEVDGTPGAASDMPGRIGFYTTPDGSGTALERMRITSTGNVGIGTTSPTDILSVKNPYTTLGVLYPIVSSQLAGTSTTLAGMYGVPEGTKAGATGIAFQTFKENSGLGERVRIDNAGNVGIGTTSPSEKLDVVGNILIESGKYLYFRNPLNDAASSIRDTASTGQTNLVFRTGGADKMILDNTGNVGIGTTNPQAKLQIENGVGRTDTSDNRISLQLSTNTDDYRVGLQTSLIGGATSVDRTLNLQAGSLRISTNVFYNGGERLALNPMGGNVGIGTTSPTGLLHLSSTTAGGTSLKLQSSAVDSYPYIQLTNDARTWTIYNSGTLSDSFDIYDATATAHRFVITSTGNVGIGTTSPTSLLNLKVDGTGYQRALKLESTNSGYNGNGTYIEFASSTSDGYGSRIGGKRIGSGATSDLSFQVYNSGIKDAMYIDYNSNVGIGTTSPNSKFHVNGSVAMAYVAKTANYTATVSDYVIDCTANSFTITLPTAVGIGGRIYHIKNTGTGLITIDAAGTETIDGELTRSISQWEVLTIQSNGSNWIIL